MSHIKNYILNLIIKNEKLIFLVLSLGTVATFLFKFHFHQIVLNFFDPTYYNEEIYYPSDNYWYTYEKFINAGKIFIPYQLTPFVPIYNTILLLIHKKIIPIINHSMLALCLCIFFGAIKKHVSGLIIPAALVALTVIFFPPGLMSLTKTEPILCWLLILAAACVLRLNLSEFSYPKKYMPMTYTTCLLLSVIVLVRPAVMYMNAAFAVGLILASIIKYKKIFFPKALSVLACCFLLPMMWMSYNMSRGIGFSMTSFNWYMVSSAVFPLVNKPVTVDDQKYGLTSLDLKIIENANQRIKHSSVNYIDTEQGKIFKNIWVDSNHISNLHQISSDCNDLPDLPECLHGNPIGIYALHVYGGNYYSWRLLFLAAKEEVEKHLTASIAPKSLSIEQELETQRLIWIHLATVSKVLTKTILESKRKEYFDVVKMFFLDHFHTQKSNLYLSCSVFLVLILLFMYRKRFQSFATDVPCLTSLYFLLVSIVHALSVSTTRYPMQRYVSMTKLFLLLSIVAALIHFFKIIQLRIPMSDSNKGQLK